MKQSYCLSRLSLNLSCFSSNSSVSPHKALTDVKNQPPEAAIVASLSRLSLKLSSFSSNRSVSLSDWRNLSKKSPSNQINKKYMALDAYLQARSPDPRRSSPYDEFLSNYRSVCCRKHTCPLFMTQPHSWGPIYPWYASCHVPAGR